MTYNPNIPQPGDDLSVSQGQILQNFQVSNSSFGVDHYSFADLTGNTGKHNQITTPIYIADPPTGDPPITGANEPKMYGFADSTNLGALNYSRGPSNMVPTPLTHFQSPLLPIVLAPGATTNVLDFTGLTYALGILYAVDTADLTNSRLITYFSWSTPFLAFRFDSLLGNSPLTSLLAQAFGNILQIKNVSAAETFNNVAWTLQFDRIWT